MAGEKRGASTPLLGLPDELLEGIVQYLGPHDTYTFACSCRRMNKVTSSSLIWRRHCLETWRHWDTKRDLAALIAQPPTETQWRQLYSERARNDREISAFFNEMLSTQKDRYHRIERIASYNEDVVDLLNDLLDNTREDAHDVLARRYHAGTVIASINRSKAVETWLSIEAGMSVELEDALGAYELFVLPDSSQGCGYLKAELDQIAQRIRICHPGMEAWSTRQKALAIARYLRCENIVGMLNEGQYHALQNNYLSTAFKEHSSLPLQSVALYCAVARRLGVDASPSNYPQRVHAVVSESSNRTIDAAESTATAEWTPERIYLDPWGSDEEVSEDHLRTRLAQMGIPLHEHDDYLGPASVIEMTRRTARNIMVSVEEARHRPASQVSHLDIEAAWYSMLWVMVILGYGDDATAGARRRQFIPYLIEHFQTHFPEDLGLLEKLPALFEGQGEHQPLLDMIVASRNSDCAERVARPRSAPNAGVMYKIGHYFRHKRYSYEGFIVGWDAHCNAGPRWIAQMRVDDLPRGREQPFYNIVADDKSTRYVAEENIELIQVKPSGVLMDLAGRYFKRWEDSTQKFESNIRDEYPDD
ncbi:hypothetical protein JX266_013482 [Neoarthrinium moseri]|nr:hypothetical protein JX266_013482 [Neoarthrinium moseri]